MMIKALKTFKENLSLKSYCTLLIAASFLLVLLLQIGILFTFSRYSNQLSNVIFKDVAKKNVEQIELLHENIEDIVMRFVTRESTQSFFFSYNLADKAKNLTTINWDLSNAVESNNNLRFLALVDNGSISFHSSANDNYSLLPLAEEFINEYPERTSVETFTSSRVFNDTIYFAYIYHIYPLNTSFRNQNTENNFVIALYCLDNLFLDSAPSFSENSFDTLITDKDNRIIYASDIKLFGKALTASKTANRSLSSTTTLDTLPWQVCVSLSEDASTSSLIFTVILILIMVIIDILILFIMFRILFYTIIGRISNLKLYIDGFSTDSHEYLRYSFNDELMPIVSAINNMLKKIYDLNKITKDKELSLHKLQLEQERIQTYYLKGQVSPHFLYNSMMHIQGIALKNNVPEISRMTSAMCKVFRYFSSNSTTTTVEKDLYYAIDYFNVINMQRKYPIKIEFDGENTILQLPIIKMVFQPILENIHKHAFSPLSQSAVVSISFEKLSGDYCAVLIRDNGCGMNDQALTKLNSMLNQNTFSQTREFPDNIGLANVNLRLQLHFDLNCGLEISSRENEGTLVKVIIKNQDA